jgi:glycosyltransferase involved in cell wall biosynthesis
MNEKRKMKIGIDAKWYFNGPPSTRTMLQNLFCHLFRLYPEHEWIIFLDKKDSKLSFPFKQKNITPLYVWADNNMVSNLFLLPRYARKKNIDIMVFQTFPPFQRKINSIAFIHDVLFKDYPKFFSWKERLYFLPLSWLTPGAHRLMATTEYVADELIKHRYSESRSRIDIIPLGVSPEFKPAEQHDNNFLRQVKEKFRLPDSFILFVGRLNIRKNIPGLLKAIPMLSNQNIHLVIVGKQDGKTVNLKKFLVEKKRVIITGPVANNELAAIYAMATLFCFPSFAEGFGLPPLEAMASGVPVVVSDTTALPEVCGDAAVYINPAEPENIAYALNGLLENPVLYNQKKKAGLERSAKYKWDITAEKFMQSIINAIKN